VKVRSPPVGFSCAGSVRFVYWTLLRYWRVLRFYVRGALLFGLQITLVCYVVAFNYLLWVGLLRCLRFAGGLLLRIPFAYRLVTGRFCAQCPIPRFPNCIALFPNSFGRCVITVALDLRFAFFVYTTTFRCVCILRSVLRIRGSSPDAYHGFGFAVGVWLPRRLLVCPLQFILRCVFGPLPHVSRCGCVGLDRWFCVFHIAHVLVAAMNVYCPRLRFAFYVSPCAFAFRFQLTQFTVLLLA